MNMENPLLQHAEDPPAKVVHRCYRCGCDIVVEERFVMYGEAYCMDCAPLVTMYDDDDLEEFIETAQLTACG